MRKKFSIFSRILILLIFIALGIGFKHYFMENIEIERISYIDDYKTIKVRFNTDIILNDFTKDNISILDSNGNAVFLRYTLDSDSKDLVIKPFDSIYNLGEEYTLKIQDVQGRWFGKLHESSEVKFVMDKLPIDPMLGLGKYITKKVSNDRQYSWYVDQAETGEYASTNCGPASAEMLGKWADETFEGYAEEARELDYGDDGGWYTENVQNYLERYGIESKIISNVTEKLIISQLDKGNIMLLGIQANEISMNEDFSEEHIDRYYWVSGGHFIIVKGYLEAEGEIYFEIYDPNSWYETYCDGTYKGKDRYYKAEEVVTASKVWYDKLLLIENN